MRKNEEICNCKMRKFVQKGLSVWIVAILNTLLIALSGGVAWASSSATGEELLEEYWNRFFLEETKTLVRIPTYREEGRQVDHHLQMTQDLLQYWAKTFNDDELTQLKLRFFEWDSGEEKEEGKQPKPPQYKVFGFRIGDGARKVSLLAHLDVVPPGSDAWRPFQPRKRVRDYQPSDDNELGTLEWLWGNQEFLVGRGTIDDKGPAISTFIVLRTLAKQFDKNSEALKDVTLELLFDTSEETDMSTPHYLEYLEDTGNADKKPDLGIVFDAMWCIRAEKGGERPTFSLIRDTTDSELPWIDDLHSGNDGNNPVNQIPDTATAIIQVRDRMTLEGFCKKVTMAYERQAPCRWPNSGTCPSWVKMSEYPYRPAEMKCQVVEGGKAELTTEVEGTQHGSGPHDNRDYGANPLVSLTNFLAYLVYENHDENGNRGIRLADNSIANMTHFIRWGWGTQVFGEKHRDLLERHDEVFEKGNGTTYAITHFQTTETNRVQLGIDVRYAIHHHIKDGEEWDGRSGFLPGEISRFGKQGEVCTDDDCLFEQLVKRFNDEHKGTTQVEVTTETLFPPEIRDPDKSQEFQKINEAFKAITGKDCPRLAIGGGTDAKGHPELWAAGALFDSKMGPPINFHGQNEGAPVEHLKIGTQILYRFLCNEIEDCK